MATRYQILTTKDIQTDGWSPANETWTYASSDNPTYTFTIASFDATSKYSNGMRVKLTDSGTQYFIITAVTFDDPGSTITVYGGNQGDLSTGTITNPFYSVVKAPLGFSTDPLNWTEETNSSNDSSINTPGAGVWTNRGGSLAIHIGAWEVSYYLVVAADDDNVTNIDISTTLSKANNSEDDDDFTCESTIVTGGAVDREYAFSFTRTKNLTLATKDTYYANVMAAAAVDRIRARGTKGARIIRAVCAYL